MREHQEGTRRIQSLAGVGLLNKGRVVAIRYLIKDVCRGVEELNRGCDVGGDACIASRRGCCGKNDSWPARNWILTEDLAALAQGNFEKFSERFWKSSPAERHFQYCTDRVVVLGLCHARLSFVA